MNESVTPQDTARANTTAGIPPHRRLFGRVVRLYHQPVAVGLVLMVVLAGSNIKERGHSRDLGLREISQETHGVADTVEASIQALVRRGHLDVQRVRMILENVVAATEVTFVTLRPAFGPAISAGKMPAVLPALDGHGGGLQNGQYLHWEVVRLQDFQLPYRHRYPDFTGYAEPGSDLDLGTTPQTLVVGMVADGYYRHVGEATARLNAILAVGTLCIVGLSTAWILSIRNRELSARLGSARLRAEHLSELELTARGLAHETRNPLGLVRGLAQRIAGDEDLPPSAREAAAAIMEQTDTASSRLGDFLAYARPRPVQPRPMAALTLIRRICGLLDPDFSGAGVALVCDGEEVYLHADPEQFEQLLVNLLLNSLQASPRGSKVTVMIKRQAGAGILSVLDEGSGIDPTLRDDLFKPYVTGRNHGHGLGLAIVRRIVESHGWTIALRSPTDAARPGGTLVTIGDMALNAEAEFPETRT